MSKAKWIKWFAPLNAEKALDAALQTADWLEENSQEDAHTKRWNVLPGKDVADEELLLKDTSLYGGAAGDALLYLRLYVATEDKKWLEKAKKGIDYCIKQYRGKEEFYTDAPYLAGAYIGFFNGAAGGAYVANLLYKLTGEDIYGEFAKTVTDDLIDAGKEENGALTWYGFYGILGEGAFPLFLLEIYQTHQDERYLKVADQAAKYIADQREESPWGGYRWNVMPTENFPTIGKPGGYFPGFPDAAKAPFIVGFDYKECIDVKGEDAYATGREIARTDGVFLGQSAAAAIYAATIVAKRPENAGKNIVVMLADNGMKYLSTNMYPLDHKVQ